MNRKTKDRTRVQVKEYRETRSSALKRMAAARRLLGLSASRQIVRKKIL